ncbi:MAG: hypothetical protein JJE25_15225 [Bacteroidia bacterium]|nr:hypothetical protein [Bacteroidia bacterium]
MSLSANSLFHFTTLDALKGILKNGFYSNCSIEQVIFSVDIFPVAIPMVSFCDIRLTQVQEHISRYGSYGIGLRKEFGVKNGINPIFYLLENTPPHRLMKRLISLSFKLNNKETKDSLVLSPDDKINLESLLEIIVFLKLKQGRRWNKSEWKFYDDVIDFYDEREWRFFPGLRKADNPNLIPLPFIPILETLDYKGGIEFWDQDNRQFPLMFTNEDLKYLIVKNENDIKHLIDYMKMENIFPEHFESAITKITTIDRIKEDH